MTTLSTTLPTPLIEEVFSTHKSFLWGLCYRLTGSAADADDLVQETFIRLMEHPPARSREAVRFVLRCDLNAAGRIQVWHAILASSKLTAARFPP